jgi:predicted nucleic acid-binding protein
VTRLVLDASVVLKWFGRRREKHRARAISLRQRYLAGEILVAVPSLLFVEALSVAGRKWRWPSSSLVELVEGLRSLGFEVIDPPWREVALWTSKGLTAYDAVYVALAESQQVALVTADQLILEVAGDVAVPPCA